MTNRLEIIQKLTVERDNLVLHRQGLAAALEDASEDERKEIVKAIADIDTDIEEYHVRLQEAMPVGVRVDREIVDRKFASAEDIFGAISPAIERERSKWRDEDDELHNKFKSDAYENALANAKKQYVESIGDAAVGVEISDGDIQKVVARSLSADALVENVKGACLERQKTRFEKVLDAINGDIVDERVVECIVPESTLRDAYASKERLSVRHVGVGKEFITRYLRETFGKQLSNRDYDELAEYENADSLIDAIYDVCAENRLYDTSVIEHIMDSISEDDMMDRSHVGTVLSHNFGYGTYSDLIKDAIHTEDGVADANRDSVKSVLMSNVSEFARIIKTAAGLDDATYTREWKERKEAIMIRNPKKAQTTREYQTYVDGLVRDAKIKEMHRLVGDVISGYGNELLLSKRAFRDAIEHDLGISRALSYTATYGVSDISTVRTNNRARLESSIVAHLKQRGRLSDDLFLESALSRRVDERNLYELGDPDHATRKLENIVKDAFRTARIDTENVITAVESAIDDKMDDVPALHEFYDDELEKLDKKANRHIDDVKTEEYDKLVWSDDEDGDDRVVDKKKVVVTKKKKEYVPGYLMPGSYRRERMSPEYEKTREKPFHKIEDMVETQGFRLKELPKTMQARGKFRVSNDEGKYMDFWTLVKVRTWYNENYEEV